MTDLLDAADRALESARLLLAHGDKAGAANRAYYSLRDAARAVLLARGVTITRIKTHNGLWAVFAELVVRPGDMPASLARIASEAERMRLALDYGATAEATPSTEEVAAVISAVAPFCAACRALVPPTASDEPPQAYPPKP